MSNMKSLLKGRGNLNNWMNMQWAAVYAMFALSNSTSGPSGALSYYLGTNFKVNHGMAGAVFIGQICKYNHDNGYYDLSELYEGRKNTLNREQKSALVVQEIDHLIELANMPENLRGFGVKETDLEGFNEFARNAKVAMDYNPVKIDPARIAELFVAI